MIVEELKDCGRSFYSLLGDRRKAVRMDFACDLTVSCEDSYSQLTTHACTCLNVSEKGIGFVSPEPMPENSDIYIHSETGNFKRFARVCYCTSKDDRNDLGCCFRAAPENWN